MCGVGPISTLARSAQLNGGLNQGSQLLTDEQVQQFIVDGFIVLDSGLPDELNEGITAELDFSLKSESRWLGDNLLPRVPRINNVLGCPVVLGAMRSLLGPDFAWTPHRFPHNSEPLGPDQKIENFDPFENQPVMGEGSISGSGWHQDGHSKAGRSRWHTFKAINVFYFPHDVPLEMGPTRLLGGTHLYATLRNIQPSQVFHRPIKAGTVIIADFDVGHAGTPNRTKQSRYMLKFVALRTTVPDAPSWDHQDSAWRTPETLLTPTQIPRAWEVLWAWLRGRPLAEACPPPDNVDIDSCISNLESPDNEIRLSALYDLIRFGEKAVEPLITKLLDAAGKNRHESPAQDDPGFYAMSPDHLERRFARRQFVPEDSAIALGAIGRPSVDSLLPLLKHADPWIRINAAYALGEVGSQLTPKESDAVGELLDESMHQVVRAAADALSWLDYSHETAAKIGRVFGEHHETWQDAAMGEPKLGGRWSFETQTHYALSWALYSRATSPSPPTNLEDVMQNALRNANSGYSADVLCQGLAAVGTPTALSEAVNYLRPRRWDVASFAPTKKG